MQELDTQSTGSFLHLGRRIRILRCTIKRRAFGTRENLLGRVHIKHFQEAV